MANAEIELTLTAASVARQTTNINSDDIATMKTASNEGNLISITDRRFAGRVLKADTITFASDSKLSFTGNQNWVALIARRILISAPEQKLLIRTHNGDLSPPPPGSTPPKQPQALSGRNGDPNHDGADGVNGADGADPIDGVDGRPGGFMTQVIYIIANEIVRQDGTAPPNFTKVTIDTRGQPGGTGGRGGDGQDGGDGGSGGTGIAGIFGCTDMAGGGGRGGTGGNGGRAGFGGIGGGGGDVVLGGSQMAMDLFSFAIIRTEGGARGLNGSAGSGGKGGQGGPRGPRPSNCDGGPRAEDGEFGRTPVDSGLEYEAPESRNGQVYYCPIDAMTLFGG